MLTKIEEVRELNGESDARDVFAMETEREAVHYVMELKKAHMKRAEQDARHVIDFIEKKFSRDKKGAIFMYRNAEGLKGLFRKYEIAEEFVQYAVDIVQAFFFAREKMIKQLKGGLLKPDVAEGEILLPPKKVDPLLEVEVKFNSLKDLKALRVKSKGLEVDEETYEKLGYSKALSMEDRESLKTKKVR